MLVCAIGRPAGKVGHFARLLCVVVSGGAQTCSVLEPWLGGLMTRVGPVVSLSFLLAVSGGANSHANPHQAVMAGQHVEHAQSIIQERGHKQIMQGHASRLRILLSPEIAT